MPGQVLGGLLLSQVDFVALLPFAVFAAIAIGVWAVSDAMFNGSSKSDERLMLIKQPMHIAWNPKKTQKVT